MIHLYQALQVKDRNFLITDDGRFGWLSTGMILGKTDAILNMQELKNTFYDQAIDHGEFRNMFAICEYIKTNYPECLI